MRRSKKQPEYDPNELADLIETPAVGSGVGSHLLIHNDPPEDLATVVTFDSPTVVDNVLTPVATDQETPVVVSEETPVVVNEKTPVAVTDPTPVATCLEMPVDSSDLTPVVISDPAPIVPGRKPFPAPPAPEPPQSDSAVDTWLEDHLEATTVVTSPAASLPRLWISDSGEIVPQSRVRRVQAAADALSTGEQALYSLLWTLPTVRQAADSRGVQAGYDSLTKATGFSRKTIQRTVDRLIAKHYIEIETPADIYRRTSTVYRVFGPGTVLERLIHRGCTHIAKIGPGVAFVTPLSNFADHSRTVDTSEEATVADTSLPTVDHS